MVQLLYIFMSLLKNAPIQIAAWSKAWVYDRLLAGFPASNPAERKCVCVCVCVCLTSVMCRAGRGLCVEPITRPEEKRKEIKNNACHSGEKHSKILQMNSIYPLN